MRHYRRWNVVSGIVLFSDGGGVGCHEVTALRELQSVDVPHARLSIDPQEKIVGEVPLSVVKHPFHFVISLHRDDQGHSVAQLSRPFSRNAGVGLEYAEQGRYHNGAF